MYTPSDMSGISQYQPLQVQHATSQQQLMVCYPLCHSGFAASSLKVVRC